MCFTPMFCVPVRCVFLCFFVLLVCSVPSPTLSAWVRGGEVELGLLVSVSLCPTTGNGDVAVVYIPQPLFPLILIGIPRTVPHTAPAHLPLFLHHRSAGGRETTPAPTHGQVCFLVLFGRLLVFGRVCGCLVFGVLGCQGRRGRGGPRLSVFCRGREGGGGRRSGSSDASGGHLWSAWGQRTGGGKGRWPCWLGCWWRTWCWWTWWPGSCRGRR